MDVDQFKEHVQRLHDNQFRKAADKANLLDDLEAVNENEQLRNELFDDDEWKKMLDDIGYCVRVECEENQKKLTSRSRALRSTIFDLWRTLILMELKDPHDNIDVDMFVDVFHEILNRNAEIWTGNERGTYLTSIELCTQVLRHYTLDDVDLGDFNDILTQALTHFQSAVDSDSRKEQYVIVDLLLVLTQNLRFVQLSVPIHDIISQLARLFGPENFKWQTKNPSRTVILDIIYQLFVDYAQNCRTELIAGFTPLFRQELMNVIIGEKTSAHLAEQHHPYDGPNFNKSLCKFLEIFVTVAFPFSVIDGWEPLHELRSLLEPFAKFLIDSLNRKLEKNVSLYNKYPERLAPRSQIQLLARMFVFEHNSLVERRALEVEQSAAKRPRLTTCLEEIVKNFGVQYLPVIDKIYLSYRSFLDPIIEKRLLRVIIYTDFTEIRKNGCIPTYIFTLSTLLLQDHSKLSDQEIKQLYQRAINWLHIPIANEAAAKLIFNCLQWMPQRFKTEMTAFYDSALKSVCRLTQFTQNSIQLLTALCRVHDFNECYNFRDDLEVSGAWRFRKQLISLVFRESNVDVDFSSLLVSLLFLYPSAAPLEELSSTRMNEISNVENDLHWMLNVPRQVPLKRCEQNESLTTSTVNEVLQHLMQQIEECFYSPSAEQSRCALIWRNFAIFTAKLTKLKKNTYEDLDIGVILASKKKMDLILSGVVDVSHEVDMDALDIGAYWEYATSVGRKAIEKAQQRFPRLSRFSVYWNYESSAVQELENAIKQPRISNSLLVGKMVMHIYGKQKLVGKIRTLERFGRYLNANEYSTLSSAVINDTEAMLTQNDKAEYAAFLRQVVCSEIILCANKNVADFQDQFDYLITHSRPEFVLTQLCPGFDKNHKLSLWFGKNCQLISEIPQQFAFFVRRLISELAVYKNLTSFLTLLDSIQKEIRYYVPKFKDIKGYMEFLSKFQEGQMLDGSTGWSHIVQSRTYPTAMLSMRAQSHVLLPTIRHMRANAVIGMALSTLTQVVNGLQMDEIEEEDCDFLFRDFVSVGNCLISSFFECEVKDDSFLSDLIIQWLHSVSSMNERAKVKTLGYSTLDLLHAHKEKYPQLWNRCLLSKTLITLQYNAVLTDPSTNTVLSQDFESAFELLSSGKFDYDTVAFQTLKCELFWYWIQPKLITSLLPEKSIPTLQLLYIFYPHLRSQICHVLCLFSNCSLRDKYHKLFARYLNNDDESNFKFLTTTLLFDYKHKFFSISVLRSLYNSLAQFYTAAKNCQTQKEIELPKINDNSSQFDVFVSNCFIDHPVEKFKSIFPAVVTESSFAIFALISLWHHLETQKESTTKIVEHIETFLHTTKDKLEDRELLLIAALSKVLCYVRIFPFSNRSLWVRSLIKAEMWMEAKYYIKYVVDFHENAKRSIFHLKAVDRISYLRSDTSIEPGVIDAFPEVVVAMKDEITAVGLPLQNQVKPEVRALMAESRCDWGMASSLHMQCNHLFEASHAYYHLGQTKFDLDYKDNYRFLIEISNWPPKESADVSYPKTVVNHNASLYASFAMTIQKSEIKMDALWKRRFAELHSKSYDNLHLLDECRDLKLIERLRISRTRIDDVVLPSDSDLGMTAAFLLADWTAPGQGEDVRPIHESHFNRIQRVLLDEAQNLRKMHSIQKAQSLVGVMEDVLLDFDSSHRQNIGLERAHLHVCNSEKNAALYLLEKILKETPESQFFSQSQTLQKSNGETQALTLLAELCGNNEKAEHYYQRGVKTAESVRHVEPSYLYSCALKYAHFAFNRYSELDAHTKSTHFQLQVEAIAQHQRQLRSANRRLSTRTEQELNIERTDNQRVLGERDRFLCTAASNFMEALSIDCSDKTIVFHLAALIIENAGNEKLMGQITDKLPNVPAKVWIPVAEILSSYIFADVGKHVTNLVIKIFIRLLVAHPFHVILSLFYHTDDENVANGTQDKRRTTTVNIFKQCQKQKREFALISKKMKDLRDIYREFGSTKIDEKNKFTCDGTNIHTMKPNAFRIQRDLSFLKSIPIPTLEQPINEPENYSTSDMILFDGVFDEVVQANGLSAPKVLRVRANNGEVYRIIFKNECLRQDSILTSLFSISNYLLEKTTFRNEKLRPLRTYRVIPIDKKLGMIEWCADTMSLNDWLVGENKKGGAHRRLRPNDEVVATAQTKMANAAKSSQEMRHVFMRICEQVTPVFRFYFYENFPQPYQFHKKIKQYTDSLALWSMVGYCVGLGDRHLNNILLDKKTAELVHIDLGMIFEFSKRALPVPEQVPFRLTRDIVDPILVEGLNSRFKHVAMHTLAEIREYTEVIVGITSIILHDPIATFHVPTADNTGRNVVAETAISRLRKKLEGRDYGVFPQTVEQQVTYLINDARDPQHLSMMFHGWLPFI
ncbi:Non-specific serine/threonine protein kinase [Aphelenchoides besseyi]|nr:Non-specific serine/threonine protein kinase [Aphelenchoides besseyi]